MPNFAVIFILLSGFLDIIDGSVARKKGLVSNIGASLDLIFDRVVEFSILFALFMLDPNRGMLILLMLGAIYLCISSFFIVSMFSDKESEKSFYYSPGIIERTEAFFFFLLLILWPSYFGLVATVFIILVGITSIVRMGQFCYHQINHHPHPKSRKEG